MSAARAQASGTASLTHTDARSVAGTRISRGFARLLVRPRSVKTCAPRASRPARSFATSTLASPGGTEAIMSNSAGSAQPPHGGAHAYAGRVRWTYKPQRNGRPDPGEIVWAWVAFEDDPTVGKDRPVVVIGLADRQRLAVLMLSSRDHSGDPHWLPIGSGPWDEQRRPSWVRANRLLAVDAHAIRREGAVLSRQIFDSLRTSFGGDKPSTVERLRRALRMPGRTRRIRGRTPPTP